MLGGGEDDSYGGGTGRTTEHGEHAARATSFTVTKKGDGFEVTEGQGRKVCSASGFMTDGCDIKWTHKDYGVITPYESGGRVDLYKQGDVANFVYESSGGGDGLGLGF